jgi:hypothetical protein
MEFDLLCEMLLAGLPWAGHRPSLQHAIVFACQAAAQRGLQSKTTAKKHTKAANFFPER